MAMPRVVIVVPWEFSNPLRNSEAQKISNFQESWNSLIQDFLYVHSNTSCVEKYPDGEENNCSLIFFQWGLFSVINLVIEIDTKY